MRRLLAAAVAAVVCLLAWADGGSAQASVPGVSGKVMRAPYPSCGNAFMVFVQSRTSSSVRYKIYATSGGALINYLGPGGYGTFEFGVGNNFYGPFNVSTTGGAASPLETDRRGSIAALTLYDDNGLIVCTDDYILL